MNDTSHFALNLLKETEQSTRTERLYERIKQMILSETLPAGYAFPNENEMCQQLQIGRGTLREAYRLLAGEGLLKRSKAGTIVSSREYIIKHAPFSVAVNYADFQNIFEFRLMLEKEMVRSTAVHASDIELENIQNIVSESDCAQNDAAKLQELDMKFHLSLAEYAHNPLLQNIYSDVWDTFASMVAANYKNLSLYAPQAIDDAISQHYEIYKALSRRDQEDACAALEKHLKAAFANRL